MLLHGGVCIHKNPYEEWLMPQHFKWTKNTRPEGMKKHGSQELVLPRSHSICHVQHTALLCFIICFNYYIHISIDMKTTAISDPVPVKVSVLQQGLKVKISAWYCADLSNPIHLTQDISTPAIRLRCSLNLMQLKPGSCSKAPCYSQSHNQARRPCITTEERCQVCICTAPYTGVRTREAPKDKETIRGCKTKMGAAAAAHQSPLYLFYKQMPSWNSSDGEDLKKTLL